jgi:hypothetical protein
MPRNYDRDTEKQRHLKRRKAYFAHGSPERKWHTRVVPDKDPCDDWLEEVYDYLYERDMD